MKMRLLLPVAVPVLALVVAAPAYAVVTYGYDAVTKSYTVDGDSAANNLTFGCLADAVTPAASPAAPCSTLESFAVYPAAGADVVDLSGITGADFPALWSIYVVNDPDFAADSFIGSELDDFFQVDSTDKVDAGAGNDVIRGGKEVDAGPGDDVIFEASGFDGVDAGPGDDRVIQTLGNGGTDGGPGHDLLDIDYDRTGANVDDATVTVTAAQFTTSYLGQVQSTFIAGFEVLRLTMLRGDRQTFDASTFPGRVYFTGSRQRDTITGSPQSDELYAGQGDDVVHARDGAYDVVDCGGGNDTAVVDAVDRVINCENVSYPRPQTRAISGPRKIKKGSSAAYAFGSSTDGAVFQCRIDKAKWKTCTSPTTIKAKGKVKAGKHTLFVRAGYPAGNWDRSPAKKKFTVKK